MMSTFCAILLLGMFAPTGEKTDLEVNGLTGPVHTVRVVQSQCFNIFFKTIERPMVVSEYTYDKQHRLLTESTYKPNGALVARWVYSYDERGHSTEVAKYEGKDRLVEKTIRTYQSDVLMQEAKYLADGSLKDRTVYTRDTVKGQVIKHIYDAANALDVEYVQKYDSSGKLLLEETCRKPGSGNHFCVSAKRIYRHDERGNRIEQTNQDSLGAPTGKLIWKYDESGNQLEHANYNRGGFLHLRLVYTYDPEGHKTETTGIDAMDRVVGRTIYDRQGRITSGAYYKINGKLYQQFFKREFDAFGNWIKEVHSRAVIDDPRATIPYARWLDKDNSTEPAVITRRTISYY